MNIDGGKDGGVGGERGVEGGEAESRLPEPPGVVRVARQQRVGPTPVQMTRRQVHLGVGGVGGVGVCGGVGGGVGGVRGGVGGVGGWKGEAKTNIWYRMTKSV